MASGYMTLPLPVIGSSIWADNWSSGDMSSNGWARSSKPFYWAALWNRCFAIIDQHDHSSTGFDSGEYSGKKLDWQTQWFTTKDLDLSKSKGDRVMNPNTSEHIKDCYYFEFSRVNYVDPSNTLDYRFKESIGDNQENRVGHEFYYENPLSSPDYNGSLFILHKKGDMFPESWATGTEQNRYGLAPERLLVWNCGNENGKLCEVVSNNPPGFRPGAWEFAGFPNSDTDTYGFGGIEGYSANPFLGVLDTRGPAQHKMHYTTTNPAVFLWATWNNAIGWFQTWYSGTGTGVITIIDEPDAYDPYFRFKTADGQGSPHTSSISKKGQNYARDWQYTQWIDGYYLPYIRV